MRQIFAAKQFLIFLSAVWYSSSSHSEGTESEQALDLNTQKEILEFLADFSEMDEEDFELLVTYAQKDSASEENDQTEIDHQSKEASHE